MTRAVGSETIASVKVEANLPERPYLRDGIDVYLGENDEITFVYLSTRKRLQLKCHPSLIESLKWMRGHKSIADIKSLFIESNPDSRLSVVAI